MTAPVHSNGSAPSAPRPARLAPFSFGLRTRLLLVILTVVVLAGGSVGLVTVTAAKAALREQTFASALASADLAAALTASYLHHSMEAVDDLAARESVRNAILGGRTELLHDELAAFVARHDQADGASAYDPDGVYRAGHIPNPPNAGLSFADREWYQGVVRTRAPYLGTPVRSRGTGRPILPYVVPIFDEAGELRGIVGSGISLLALSNAIARAPVGPAGRATLSDLRGAGMVLTHTDPTRLLESPLPSTPAVQALMAGERGVVEQTSLYGDTTLVGYTPVPGLPLGIAVIQPTAAAFAPIDQMAQNAVLLGSVVTLLASALGIWLGLHLTRPLWRLRQIADEFAAGDLARRAALTQHDEIGDLGRSFDRMADRLADRTTLLEATVSHLNAANAELSREVDVRERAEADVRRLNQTLEQRALALQEANREIEAFSYSVAHDLRSPLRSVDGFSHLVMTRSGAELATESRRYLQLVREGAQQMERLIDSLIFVFGLNRRPLRLDVVEPEALVRAAFAALAPAIDGRTVELTLGRLPSCRADPALLRLVFDHLLSNAVRFTQVREVARIEVSGSVVDGRPVYTVRDNGVGFDPRYQDRLFQVFQRLHRADEPERIGIGLAIVQQIVRRHGGTVWAESVPGEGATFSFTLSGEVPDDSA